MTTSLLYNGSRFIGHQKSKGSQYDVEVVLQVLYLFNLYVGIDKRATLIFKNISDLESLSTANLMNMHFRLTIIPTQHNFLTLYKCNLNSPNQIWLEELIRLYFYKHQNWAFVKDLIFSFSMLTRKMRTCVATSRSRTWQTSIQRWSHSLTGR